MYDDEYYSFTYFKSSEKCIIEYTSKNELLLHLNSPFLQLFNCSLVKCPNGFFLCSFYRFCIPITLVCDGINHCLRNEDEIFCSRIF